MTERLGAMLCDQLTIMRGKYLLPGKMCDDESRFAQPAFSGHCDKVLLREVPGTMSLQAIPDMALRSKRGRGRPKGWVPHTKVVTGDLNGAERAPLPLCPVWGAETGGGGLGGVQNGAQGRDKARRPMPFSAPAKGAAFLTTPVG